MNGRIYDPLLGRFLSADVIVQAPGNLQCYNRYSYVLNNPLTHFDPSGFEYKDKVAGAEEGVAHGVVNIVNSEPVADLQSSASFGHALAAVCSFLGMDKAAASLERAATYVDTSAKVAAQGNEGLKNAISNGASNLNGSNVNAPDRTTTRNVVETTTMIAAPVVASLAVATKATPAESPVEENKANPQGAPDGSKVSTQLPAYDGKTTHGVLTTNEGDTVHLTSGNADPRYANYPAASHVEGKAAIAIRDSGSSGGTVEHNNTGGTCGFCNAQLPTLLPEGAQLTVVPPANAVPANSRAVAVPTTYVGNANEPKPPKTPAEIAAGTN